MFLERAWRPPLNRREIQERRLLWMRVAFSKAQTADLRAVDRCDNRFVLARMIGMTVGDVTPLARSHRIDPKVEGAYVERLLREAEHPGEQMFGMARSETCARAARLKNAWHASMKISQIHSATRRS